MRPSETPRQALERELREELGVSPRIGELAQMVRHPYAEMSEPVQISFLRAALEERPRNLAFAQIVWSRRTELPLYDFLAADRQVISRLVRGEILMPSEKPRREDLFTMGSRRLRLQPEFGL